MTNSAQFQYPRPLSSFRAADGSAPTLDESLLLLFESLAAHQLLDHTSRQGPEGEERDVSGSDVVFAIRELLSSQEGRQTLVRLTKPEILPHVQGAAIQLGYAGVRIQEQEEELWRSSQVEGAQGS